MHQVRLRFNRHALFNMFNAAAACAGLLHGYDVMERRKPAALRAYALRNRVVGVGTRQGGAHSSSIVQCCLHVCSRVTLRVAGAGGRSVGRMFVTGRRTLPY